MSEALIEAVAKARETLDYDPSTGIFRWKMHRSSNAPRGSEAGYATDRGYIEIKLSGKVLKAHRLAWVLVYGTWPDGFIDHINGNRADNRIENLRVATRTENQRNSRLRTDNKSGVRGVRWAAREQKWHATIKNGGVSKFLGSFASKSDAIAARRDAEIETFGGFSRDYGDAPRAAWRKIESVPKDGSLIDVWCDAGRVTDCWFSDGALWTINRRGGDVYRAEVCNATHWMPVPPPPT